MAPSSSKPTAAKPSGPTKAEKPEKPARTVKATKTAATSVAKPTPAAKPAAATIKLRDLADSVANATGAKKADAKASVEAVLAAIGAGLAAKSVLVVPPLGKLRVAKANGSVLTLKLRLADTSRAAGLALADDDEDS